MRKVAFFLLALVLIATCFGCSMANRVKLVDLEIGLNQAQVMELLGKPYKTEGHLDGDRQVEYWFYMIEPSIGQHLESDFTALCFVNDSLVGWGDRRRLVAR